MGICITYPDVGNGEPIWYSGAVMEKNHAVSPAKSISVGSIINTSQYTTTLHILRQK